MYLFYSVSVEVCVFLTRTKYDTARWTPGGNIMMVRSLDGGAFWSQPQVRSRPLTPDPDQRTPESVLTGILARFQCA